LGTAPEPLEILRTNVKREWLDYNQHMNAGYYAVAFDRAVERFMLRLGMGEAYAKTGVGTTFCLQSHIIYLRELEKDAPIRATLQLIDYDKKRMHLFLGLFHADEGFLAATSENISIHIDLRTRRSAPMPETVLGELEALWNEHQHLPKPEQAGQSIGIRRL
jgi:acyl-CoA thioester hydrolase